MERGLLWLPLLGTFITLTWLGWRSYRQVESYRQWATDFETAKYDAAAVAGLKEGVLTWGQPHPNGPTHLQSIGLDRVQQIELLVDDKPIDWPPQDIPRGKIFAVKLVPADRKVPFSDAKLAIAWCQKLKQVRKTLG